MHPEPSSVPEGLFPSFSCCFDYSNAIYLHFSLYLLSVTMDDGNLPPTARPLVKKLFETTENPEYNRLRKQHLDLFVRGRRGMPLLISCHLTSPHLTSPYLTSFDVHVDVGAKLDEKTGFKGSVALGLEEAINLRDAWREQKQDKTVCLFTFIFCYCFNLLYYISVYVLLLLFLFFFCYCLIYF